MCVCGKNALKERKILIVNKNDDGGEIDGVGRKALL